MNTMKLFSVGLLTVVLSISETVFSPAQCVEKTTTDTNAISSSSEIRLTLFDNSTDDRKRMGYLIIDEHGLPSIYPVSKRNLPSDPNNSLSNLSKNELTQIWALSSLNESVSRASFVGWEKGWTVFSVDLKFEGQKCIAFKIQGTDLKKDEWIDCTQMPYDLHRTRLTLPVQIGCVEGPRTRLRCNFVTPLK